MKKKILLSFIFMCISIFSFGAINSFAYTGTQYGDIYYTVDGSEITISDCDDYATNVVIPETINGQPVTKIAERAFQNKNYLITLEVPGCVKTIEKWAFECSTNLEELILHDGIETIGEGICICCYKLESVVIPGTVKSMGYGLFEDCSNLKKVEYSDGITTIVSSALYKLTGLETVIIPKTVTSIGNRAFYGCSSLAEVYYNGKSSDWSKITIDTGNDPLTNATLKSFYYVNIIDTNNNTLTFKYLEDETIDFAALEKNYTYKKVRLFPNQQFNLTEEFLETALVKEDTTLYMMLSDVGTQTTVSPDGTTFTVNVQYIPTGSTVIVALYDANGQLVDMQTATYNGTAVTLTTNVTYTTAKVMAWDNLNNMTPLCNAETIV